ncbi:hypothetical protein ACKWTF_006517 [Chironomus riparius]
MHIEIQVALNFVISYLYNKLPRRRVNIFGEELEKALKHKFQGHWYPDKPFKGSAFRCLKTGEPIDIVLEIAARESGVPIGDILENLPAELSVWVDPGEVSYRIGEKGAVKILYSEQKHDSPDDNNADREVTSTFNPEAQCFRPIEILNSSLNGLTLSPKGSPNDSSPTSSISPMYKNNSPSGNNGTTTTSSSTSATFLGRTQEPVLFTTATFAQTKFGSTKLKNNSKRTNRMSPTEFSNYIKQRQQMQQHNNHYNHHQSNNHHQNMFGAIGSVSPARSISPNPMTLQMTNDSSMHQNPFVFPSNGFNNLNMYQSFGSPRNMFDGLNGSGNGNGNGNYNQFNGNNDPLLFTPGKSSSFMDQQSNYCKIPSQQQQQQQNSQSPLNATSPQASTTITNGSSNNVGAIGTSVTSNQQQQSDNKLLDGMNSFYGNNSNPSSYQHHLLVAN